MELLLTVCCFFSIIILLHWIICYESSLGLEDQNSTSDSSLEIILKGSKVQRFYYYLMCVRVININFFMMRCWLVASSLSNFFVLFIINVCIVSTTSYFSAAANLSFNMTLCRATDGRIESSSMATGTICSLLYTIFYVTKCLYLLLSHSFYWIYWYMI